MIYSLIIVIYATEYTILIVAIMFNDEGVII